MSMSDTTPLTGEPLALDLVNTRPSTGDLLDSPARLKAWLALQADRLPAEEAGIIEADNTEVEITEADVAAVQAVREQIAAAVHAVLHDQAPPAKALRSLNESQRAAPAVRELAWNGSGVVAAPRRDGPLGTRLAAILAEAAADLLTDPALGKVRQCEAEDCVMVFLPAHPRRRWCSPARCGNRARVARYYRRHKAGEPAGGHLDDQAGDREV
ncbi:CGNR zinc finger domain-containing protein [Actinomadura sp. 6N118]|uniref:CGNR zinc finger domain-containing protein n=1 Tax=Actinomadura sp. 6N118 TaxID=3375151 RepID=UPI0037990B13